MKTSFNAKEYGRLLELVHLGLWVAGARPDDPATMPERYAEIAQKVFALAEPFGCADQVEVDVNGQLFLNEKITQGPVLKKLEQFADEVFWSELASRLAERDIRAEAGKPEDDELDDEEVDRLVNLEEEYWREFEEHGVDHIVMLRGGRG